MHLRKALAAMWADLKHGVRVRYARLHPEYDVIDVGGEPLVFPPIDVDSLVEDIEAGFEDASAPRHEQVQMGGMTVNIVECEESGMGVAMDRSQSMDDPEVAFTDGPLAQAASAGHVLLLDEVNAPPADE